MSGYAGERVIAPASGVVLERGAQLERLSDVLTGVAAGAGGASVVIVGEGGVGKTSVLAEVERAVPSGLRWLRARGDELEADYAYGVVRQLLEPALLALDDPAAAWADGAVHARSLFDVASADAGGAADDVAFARQQGLFWLVLNLADLLGPLVLCVDDAHRADAASLRFLRFLSHRIDQVPVAAVLATRPPPEIDELPALVDLLDDPASVVVGVDRLSADATAEYVASAWEGAPRTLADLCHELTAGNPLMLRALLAEAARAGIVPGAPDAERRLRELGVPSIAQRVRRALRVAPAGTLAVARAVAVLGDGARPVDVLALSGVDADAAGAGMDALLRLGVLEESGGGLRFVHPLVRTSVSGLGTPLERAALHGQAASMLHGRGAAAEEVAAHLLATSPVGEDWAGGVLRSAAERALAMGAPEVAARMLRRALDEPVADRAALLADLGGAASLAALPEALGYYEQALALHADAQIAERYAGALAMSGDLRRSFAVMLDAAGTDVAESVPPGVQAALHAASLFVDEPAALAYRAEVQATIDQQIRAIRPGMDDDWRLLACTLAYELVVCGRDAKTVGSVIGPALAGTGLPLTPATASVWGYGIWALLLTERYAQARAELDRQVQAARNDGALLPLGLALCLRGGLHAYQGRLQLAEDDCRESLSLAEFPAWRFGIAGCTQFLLRTLIAQGRYDEAEATLDALSPEQRGVGAPSVETLFRLARAQLLLARREHGAALAEALELGRSVGNAGFDGGTFVPWRTVAASAALGAGDTDRARALAMEQFGRAQAFGAPGQLAEALLSLAEVEEDGRAARIATAREHADQVDAPLLRARVLLAAGRARRVAGEPTAARDDLREALALATACGATPIADAALDELAASGAKPRRRGREAADELTAAESRVARMAAAGATNREIAQALFVTAKTVEMHLSRSYRKLGITSRAQLASRLEGVEAA